MIEQNVAMRRYSDQSTRERAIGMYTARLAARGGSQVGARRYVGAMLGVSEATVRRWITTHETLVALSDPAAEADRAAKHAALRQQRANERRAIDLLIAASAEFAVADVLSRSGR